MGDKKPKKNSSGDHAAYDAKKAKTASDKFLGTPKPDEKDKGKKK